MHVQTNEHKINISKFKLNFIYTFMLSYNFAISCRQIYCTTNTRETKALQNANLQSALTT